MTKRRRIPSVSPSYLDGAPGEERLRSGAGRPGSEAVFALGERGWVEKKVCVQWRVPLEIRRAAFESCASQFRPAHLPPKRLAPAEAWVGSLDQVLGAASRVPTIVGGLPVGGLPPGSGGAGGPALREWAMWGCSVPLVGQVMQALGQSATFR